MDNQRDRFICTECVPTKKWSMSQSNLSRADPLKFIGLLKEFLEICVISNCRKPLKSTLKKTGFVDNFEMRACQGQRNEVQRVSFHMGWLFDELTETKFCDHVNDFEI